MENESLEVKIERFKRMVSESQKIVFFGGAGVSTESGIPDFRSVDGLYNQEWDYPPETILSHTFFYENPKEFWRFYRKKILLKGMKPNITHLALAQLEKQGKLSAVITQNIDGLHQAAGSKKVYELHGTVLKNHCINCGKFFDGEYVMTHEEKDSPLCLCDECGAKVKPDVVLYEEGLDDNVLNGSIQAIAEADMLIIGGTSLTVYPAAGLVKFFRGDNLVVINKSPTPSDVYADLVINDSLGKVFGALDL